MEDLDLGNTIKGFSPGQKILNRYKLDRILGRGGMGVVWLARDEELNRDVALKFLPEIVANDPVAIADMKREVRRAIELSHPHIIKTNDFVTDGRTTAVSMEYAPGGTLSVARLEQPGQVFQPEQLAPWMEQLCAALVYAHRDAEVVHRDLKPSNLMLDAKGRLKVVDFGIAASISESVTRVSKQAGSSGTPVYMSPQQMMGEEPAPTDDIYAMGATLFELLTGKPPFHAGNIMLQVQSKPAPLLNERRKTLGLASVPEEWERAIARCLAKDAKERPQSAGEVAARLGLASSSNAQRPTQHAATAAKTEPPTLGIPRPTRGSGLGANPRAQIANRKSKAPAFAALTATILIVIVGAAIFSQTEPGILGSDSGGPPSEKPLSPVAGAPWTNSLGLKFVPVPGTDVLFSIWETRERDYEAFVQATGRKWIIGGDRRGANHPAKYVSWSDARAFCAWLTEKERGEGILRYDQSYRLPLDWEWSVAVGLDEDRNATPQSKSGAIKGIYPWGTQWPPPPEAGNLGFGVKAGRYPDSVPVGSFAANRFGLHDLGGNVVEWCSDVLENSQIARGGSFHGKSWADTDGNPGRQLSSYREVVYNPDYMSTTTGFRLVVDAGAAQPVGTAAAMGERPEAGKPWSIADLGLTLLPVSPGSFAMGSNHESSNPEQPVTQVRLTQPFWLGRTEVTQRQWKTLMGGNPANGKGDQRPVETIPWEQAMEFCRRLTAREREAGRLPEGYDYTLPTEAQWEYACRAGTTGDYAGDPKAMAWADLYKDSDTRPVGLKQPNAWGFFDMHGNVSEWCLDWLDRYPGGHATDPTGPASGSERVHRGGSVFNATRGVRSAWRHSLSAGQQNNYVGLRVALVQQTGGPGP